MRSINKFRPILLDDWSVRADKGSQPLNHLAAIQVIKDITGYEVSENRNK